MGHNVKFITMTEIKKDKTILKVAEGLDINIKTSCDGKGKCGKCIVKASGQLSEITKTELKHLSEEKIAAGFRLACEAKITGDAEIFLSE